MSMDAGGFKRTATDIRGQIKNLDRELKGMGKDVDAEKLAEKLNLQEAAVKNLSSAVDEAKRNFSNAKSEADKLAQAKRLSTLTTDLEVAKNAAEETRKALADIDAIKWKNFGKTLTDMGGNIRRFGRTFSLYVSGPLGVLGGKAYKDALAYEEVTADLGVASEKTGEELEALKNQFIDLSTEIPHTYTELAGLGATLARADVPADKLEHVTRIIAGLGKTTDVSAEASAAAMIKFMNVMNIPLDQAENFASTLVALGNAGVSTGSEIFEMAQRMAATGNLAGMSAVEILAMASAFSSLGISSEAGGSAFSKLIKAMQLAAETGKGLGGMLDEEGNTVMGFATAMGITAEEFQRSWSKDQVGTVLAFFDALKTQAADGGDSVLKMLDALDLTEIRLSNLIATGASNPNFFKEMLGLGEDAWRDNTALAKAVEKAYSTAQARQDIALNKIENTSADVGENVVDIWQPVIEVVSNLVAEFGKLDEATQSRWVAIGAGLVALGPAASGIGAAASGVGKIVGWIGKVKAGEVTVFEKLVKAISGPAGGWLLAAAGIGAVVWALNDIKTPSEQIIEGLQSIKVELDEETYNQTRQALAELKGQSDALAGKQGEHNKNISAAVKAGYGTTGMYGTALGYEARFTEAQLAEIAGRYADDIDKLNGMIGAETDKAQQAALAERRDALMAQRDAEVDAAKASYMAQVSALVDGMMQAQPEARAAMLKAAKEYDLLVAIMNGMAEANTAGGKGAQEMEAMWENILTPDVMAEYLPDAVGEKASRYALDVQEVLMQSLQDTVRTIGGEDSFAYTLLRTILDDPLASGFYDPTLTQGALDGLVEALDFKGAADELGTAFEDGLTPGLADAIEGAKSPAMEKLGALGGQLEREAARQGAAMGAAMSAAFSANLNLNVNAPGTVGTAGINQLRRELMAADKRTVRGYGKA